MTDKKIFDLGFPKTGTTSLESALEILGYDVCKGHFQSNYSNYLMALCVNEDFEEVVRISRYWQAFCDLPWGGTNLYKTLVQVYPSAKFIITTRDPNDWYESLEKMLTKLDRNLDTCIETMHRNGRFGFVYYFKDFFEVEVLAGGREKIIERYVKHNEELELYLAKKNIEYLRFSIAEGDGWGKLCEFLEVPPPADVSFPHMNKAPRT